MKRDGHLSDEALVLDADGELTSARAREIAGHLAACPICRARRRELEDAADRFVRWRTVALPSSEAPRARLRARLATWEPARPAAPGWWRVAAAAMVLAGAGILGLYHVHKEEARSTWVNQAAEIPSPRLTPGAARAIDREELCHSALPKNGVVPAGLRQRVFAAYGMANADPRGFEVDYLITPALGGAEDIRNLWPQPYRSAVWNAGVKDALEDRLRDLVCRGQLDLNEAQRAISTDWIAAYKKYFRTDAPREP